MAKYSEHGFIPMCKLDSGKPWFAPNALRWYAKDAREAFVDMCHGPNAPDDAWKSLRNEGWRIVKVRITIHQ